MELVERLRELGLESSVQIPSADRATLTEAADLLEQALKIIQALVDDCADLDDEVHPMVPLPVEQQEASIKAAMLFLTKSQGEKIDG